MPTRLRSATARLRGLVQPPRGLLDRARWLFLGVTLLALGAQVLLLVLGAATRPGLRAAGLVGVAWLGWWWVTGYRRGRFPIAGELGATVALVLIGVAATNPEYALGVTFTAVYLRALYGGRVQAALVLAEFAGANLVALAIVHAPTQPLLSTTTFTTIVPGLPMAVVLMQVLKRALVRNERALDRERILRGASISVLANPDAGAALATVHHAVAEVVALIPSFEVVVASLLGGAPDPLGTIAAAHGGLRAVGIPWSPVGPPPAVVDHAGHLRQGAPGFAEVAESVGLGDGVTDLLLVPLAVDDEPLEVLVVGGPAPVPAATADGLAALVGSTALALSRRRAVARRTAGEDRFRALAQAVSDLVVAVGPDRELVYASPSVEALVDHALGGTVLAGLPDLVAAEDQPALDAALQDVRSRAGSSRALILRLRHRDGGWRTFEVLLTNLLEDPVARAVVLTARDVTDQTALEEQLRHQALHDPLTGLANRALLRDRLEHALASRERTGEPLTLLALDLDDFKDVNDGFGHGSGDHVLVEVTRRIQRCLRAADTFARLGGDEFAILLGGEADSDAGAALAERIAVALEPPIWLAETVEVRAGTSIGIVTTREAAGADILLRNADIALYTAKSEGKGRATQYRSVLHDRVMQRVQMEAGLRLALEQGAFRLQYQPILTVADRQLTGVEALVRWHDPLRGVVGPDDFIPIAEATGLILPIGRWVLWEACRQMVAWRASHPQLGRLDLAVNVSARQLATPGYVAEVEATLRNSGLPPGQLVLEVTETTVIRDIEAVAVRLGELRGLGVRIAIDDFGTGNSSLGQLRRLPVDILKIDRTFLHELTVSPAGAAVVQTVVDLGRALQLRVVAEGVETADQAREFAALSDDGRVQGFFFSRPLDPADLEALDLGSAPASSARPDRLSPAVPVGPGRLAPA